jgi:RNA polymerase sigma-70 factor (ECF subfamily)
VIRFDVGGHEGTVSDDARSDLLAPPALSAGVAFRALVRDHLDFTWRSLRRLGLPADVADDATQRVFLVASQKLASIEPGRERAFLFNTAVRVASSEKRTFARRREDLTGDATDDVRDARAGADELLDHHRARTLLEELLTGLPMDLRTVFVLFELEGLTTVEIADALGIARGTAASRLRRAREEFRAALKRHEARLAPAKRRT